MAIEILAVGQHLAAGGAAPAVETIHQRALAGSAGFQQSDELARFDDEIDVVEQFALLTGRQGNDFFEAAGFQPQTAAVVDRADNALIEREQERPDADALPFLDEDGSREPLAADPDAGH